MDRNILKNRKAFRKSFKMFAFVSAFSFALLSCDGIAQKNRRGGADSYETKEFIVSGTFSLEGAIPSEIASLFRSEKENEGGNARTEANKNARTAVPSVPELSGLFFNVTATKSASSSVSVSGEVLRGNSPSFTVKLSEGEWTLKADAFSDSGKTKKVLSGSSDLFSLSRASPVKNDISIILSPVNEGSGKVSLPVGWTIDSGIRSVKITFEVLNDITKTLGTNVTDKDFEGTLEFDSDIQSGSHTAKLEFYGESGGGGTLRYSTREVINVFQNLTTDTWQGNVPYLTETNGKTEFKVTKNLVDTFTLTTFYVKGERSTNLPGGKEADDTNTGTPFDPFKTVQAAVDKVVRLNDGTSSYKIYVDGTFNAVNAGQNAFKTGDAYHDTNKVLGDGSNALVKIENNSNGKMLDLTIEGMAESATLDAQRTDSLRGRVIYIHNSGSGIKLSLKKLKVTGGYCENAAGIYFSGTKAEDTLNLENIVICKNTATENGAGLYISYFDNDASKTTHIRIKGGTIGGSTSAEGNKAGKYGGGIYISQNTSDVTVTDCSIMNNEAKERGSGIYFSSSLPTDKLSLEGNTYFSGNCYNNQGYCGSIFVAGRNGTVSLGKDVQIASEQGKNELCLSFYKSAAGTENCCSAIKVNERLSSFRAKLSLIDNLNVSQDVYADAVTKKAALIKAGDGYSLTAEDLSKFEVAAAPDGNNYSIKLDSDSGTGILFKKE